MGLIDDVKNGTLDGTVMVCRKCNKAVNIGHGLVSAYKAKEFDTYLFYCPNCKNLLAIEYDFRDGETSETMHAEAMRDGGDYRYDDPM